MPTTSNPKPQFTAQELRSKVLSTIESYKAQLEYWQKILTIAPQFEGQKIGKRLCDKFHALITLAWLFGLLSSHAFFSANILSVLVVKSSQPAIFRGMLVVFAFVPQVLENNHFAGFSYLSTTLERIRSWKVCELSERFQRLRMQRFCSVKWKQKKRLLYVVKPQFRH